MAVAKPLINPLVQDAIARANDLPAMPHAALEVLRVANDERSGSCELAAAVSLDPILAAQILRLVNSGLFGRRIEVKSLKVACAQLGFSEIKMLTLSLALRRGVRRAPDSSFDYDGFWRGSLVRAAAMKLLARHALPALEDESLLAGLLSKIGQLVLASCLTKEYERVLAAAPRRPTSEEEIRVLGFSSQELGAVLLRTWNVTPAIYSTVLFADRADLSDSDIPEEARLLVRLSELASLIERTCCHSDENPDRTQLRLRTSAQVKLSAATLDAVISDVSDQAERLAEALDISICNPAATGDSLRETRQRLIGELVNVLQREVDSGRPVGNSLLFQAHAASSTWL